MRWRLRPPFLFEVPSGASHRYQDIFMSFCACFSRCDLTNNGPVQRLVLEGNPMACVTTIFSPANPFPKVIRTRFATASPTRSSIWSTAKPRKTGVDPWNVRVACETLATTNRVVIAGEVRVPPSADEEGQARQRASSIRRKFKSVAAQGDPRHRLRAGRLPLEDGEDRRAAAFAVGRHRPGRRQRRRPAGRRRCRRPGHHVRLCLQRDAGPDAGADLLLPQDPRSSSPPPARRARAKPASSAPTPRARSPSATSTASRPR